MRYKKVDRKEGRRMEKVIQIKKDGKAGGWVADGRNRGCLRGSEGDDERFTGHIPVGTQLRTPGKL